MRSLLTKLINWACSMGFINLPFTYMYVINHEFPGVIQISSFEARADTVEREVNQ